MNQELSLAQQVAAAVGCSGDEVDRIFGNFGLHTVAASRRHRSLRTDRLRIRGQKAGLFEPGAFDETFRFGPGVTVITAGNLRGKSTILEVLTLVLRGSPRDLQPDVRSWLTNVSLDVHINGQPIGFRLKLRDGEIVEGLILAGSPDDLLASDDSPSEGTTELRFANSDDDWELEVSSFMLTQLGLEEIKVFNKPKAGQEEGMIKSHGWPSYFGVVYPPAAADRILLGSTTGDSLPVKLMQVFLDMPEATRWMRTSAIAKRLDNEFKVEQRREHGLKAFLAGRLDEARSREAAAVARLKRLEARGSAENLQELGKIVAEAESRLRAARQDADSTRSAFEGARRERIEADRALITLKESAAANALFQGLDPRCCPRCETEISGERKRQEKEAHHCSVCDAELSIDDEDDFAEREQLATAALEATRAAESALSAAKTAAESKLKVAQQDLTAIDGRIARARAAQQETERREAEQELAGAKAVIKELGAMAPNQAKQTAAQVVLAAAEKILAERIKQASAGLYNDLSDAVCELGSAFGIEELEGIKVKANGHMDVTKGGGATASFGSQSPGERLRLRYALVVGLLRTARNRGIAGHPGLLLLDSIKAEEVQDDHAQTLLEGLVTAAEEEPSLQILVTTADMSLAGAVSGVAATITPKPGWTTLF